MRCLSVSKKYQSAFVWSGQLLIYHQHMLRIVSSVLMYCLLVLAAL